MPNEAELRRTGVSFEQAFTATAMCSPSRATLLTGTYPSRHGVTLTLTNGDLWPDPRNVPDVLRTVGRLLASGDVPRARLARAFCAAALLRLGPKSGQRARAAAPAMPTLGHAAARARLHVALKGKWHLTKPVEGERAGATPTRGGIERDYGFAGWEPPDAGGTRRPSHFGGGNAGRSGMGWDEDYTRQVERWLRRGPARAVLPDRLARQPPRRARLPALVSRAAATAASEFARPGRPAAADDRRGPARQAGGARADAARPDVLHRPAARRARRSATTSTSTPTCTSVVDEKIGRLLPRSATPATRARCARAR